MNPEDVLWVVTKDLFAEEDEGDEPKTGLGQTFADHEKRSWFRIWVSEDLGERQVQDPVRFRTKDDDGEVYYEGVIRKDILFSSDEDLGGGPHYWSMNDSGSVQMDIFVDGKWEDYIS